ncbi:MAG: phospholipid-binding protein MlaC [Amphiplicatus sp.]
MIARPAAFLAAGFVVLAGLAAPALAAEKAAPAAAAEASPEVSQAIAFAKKMTQEATTALTSTGTSEAQKLAAFQKVLAEGLALDVIGKFMLGENRKHMSETQIARYDAIFPDYITRLYADQFADIVGKPLEVREAKAIGAKDVIVRTQFPREDGAPIPVDWRVRSLKDGSQKMIDIIVSGISIMLVKREEFSSFIAKSGVDALLARLENEAKPA